MYCASCGTEIEKETSYCPNCGHEIGTDPSASSSGSRRSSEPVGREKKGDSPSIEHGADYDIAMSIEDGLRRRKPFRLILDVIAIFVTAGFWTGWIGMELIIHHYNLKKGKVEPWEEGMDKEFWIN